MSHFGCVVDVGFIATYWHDVLACECLKSFLRPCLERDIFLDGEGKYAHKEYPYSYMWAKPKLNIAKVPMLLLLLLLLTPLPATCAGNSPTDEYLHQLLTE